MLDWGNPGQLKSAHVALRRCLAPELSSGLASWQFFDASAGGARVVGSGQLPQGSS